MIPRAATDVVRARLGRYPAVALVGPRQAGKTTLARSLSTAYFDLEQPGERVRLDLQWDQMMSAGHLLVLDEAQSWPDLFPRLRGNIDRDRRSGRFLLLGSVSPALMTQVSESLAGRLSLVELTPLLRTELPDLPLHDVWLRGGYPGGGVIDDGVFPRWQIDYLALLAQRDLPNWGLAARPQVTDRLLRMIAAVHGQTWNASQIGQGLGLSFNTVNHHTDFLEGAFLVRRLPSYQANLRKRLVKAPKVYWRDSGLLHALLGVVSVDDLLTRPWVGASWEGFVVEQIVSTLAVGGTEIKPHFFRTSDGYEIDLVFERGKQLWAIEIKLTTNPAPEDLDRLKKTAALIGAHKSFLVSQTSETIEGKNAVSCSLDWLLGRLDG